MMCICYPKCRFECPSTLCIYMWHLLLIGFLYIYWWFCIPVLWCWPSSCRSWSILMQVSVIKHISMSFRVMWWRRTSSLDLIDCIFISSILMGVWFHSVILHFGSDQSKCWWTPLFEDHALTLFLSPPQPLNFLLNPNHLFLEFWHPVCVCRIVWDWWCVGRQGCMANDHYHLFC